MGAKDDKKATETVLAVLQDEGSVRAQWKLNWDLRSASAHRGSLNHGPRIAGVNNFTYVLLAPLHKWQSG
jgi:hypothetical protein